MNALMLLANYSGSYNSGNIMFNKSTKKTGIPRQNFLISCNGSSFSALYIFFIIISLVLIIKKVSWRFDLLDMLSLQ